MEKKLGIPTKNQRPTFKNKPLPDNSRAVFHRTSSTLSKVQKDPQKLDKCLLAMQKCIDHGFVEMVPESDLKLAPGKTWIIPVFSVPKSDGSCRLVFDCTAQFEGTSLNEVLLRGPDLNNSLRGVLLRYREKQVALCVDIKHMFNCFLVPEQHRDYLRFYWWKENSS